MEGAEVEGVQGEGPEGEGAEGEGCGTASGPDACSMCCQAVHECAPPASLPCRQQSPATPTAQRALVQRRRASSMTHNTLSNSCQFVPETEEGPHEADVQPLATTADPFGSACTTCARPLPSIARIQKKMNSTRRPDEMK